MILQARSKAGFRMETRGKNFFQVAILNVWKRFSKKKSMHNFYNYMRDKTCLSVQEFVKIWPTKVGMQWPIHWEDSFHFILNIAVFLAYKETAVLEAFSAAGVKHAISRGCAAGHLKKCHCAEAGNIVETRQTWKWGGCGDNLSYGHSFTTKFFGGGPMKSIRKMKQVSRSTLKHAPTDSIRFLRLRFSNISFLTVASYQKSNLHCVSV